MSINLTKGLLRGCKDGLGGIKKIYLFKYVQYSRSLILTTDLVLTSFPATNLYEFHVDNNPDFSNNGQENEGGKFYDEKISLDFVGINLYNEFRDFLNYDLRMIVQDNNGIYRMLGVYNGLTVDTLSQVTGNAHSDFAGYRVSFDGLEKQPALFINDINGLSFTIIIDNFLALENGEYILTEENKLIIIE